MTLKMGTYTCGGHEAVVTETDNESTAFPEIKPIDAGPQLGRFMTAMRRLQDIVVSTNPDDTLWGDAAGQVEDLCARLEVHRAPQGVAPAGRGPQLPGLGHPLMPPWMMTEAGPDGVTMQGTSAASTSAATTPCTVA
jgi:hypothetical protein